MILSEKELEQLIRSVPSIGPYHAGAGEAARLIAEKLGGVVWEKVVDIEEAATGEWTGLYDEDGYVGKLNGTIGEGLDGQRVTLTVTKEEGEDAADQIG